MRTEERDLYGILGVAPDATQDQIRAAYRAAAKQNHPDRFASYVQRLRATKRMQEINHAYGVLRDPQRRKAYDAAYSARRHAHARHAHEGGQRATPDAQPPQRERITKEDVITIACWLAGSAVCAYLLTRGKAPGSIKDYLFIAAVSLVLSPLLFVTIAAALAIPVGAMALAFSESYREKQWDLRAGTVHVWRDLLLRLTLLALVVFLFAWALDAGISSALPYLLLLGWGGGVLGELVAMILWLTQRRAVVATTIALLDT